MLLYSLSMALSKPELCLFNPEYVLILSQSGTSFLADDDLFSFSIFRLQKSIKRYRLQILALLQVSGIEGEWRRARSHTKQLINFDILIKGKS